MVSTYLSSTFLSSESLSCLVVLLMCLKSGKTWFLEWELLNNTSVVMTLILDWMSFTFLVFVMSMSSMVLYYSGEYMSGENYMNRFMYLVLAFCDIYGLFHYHSQLH